MVLNKPSTTKVNILGTEYTIFIENEKDQEEFERADGYFDDTVKEIHIAIREPSNHDKLGMIDYRKKVLRHEIIHAFMFESGLDCNAGQYNDAWSRNEEMIDWWAIQFHKIEKVFKELKI